MITTELIVKLPVNTYQRLRYVAQREGRRVQMQAETLIEQGLERVEERIMDGEPARKFSRLWRRRL